MFRCVESGLNVELEWVGWTTLCAPLLLRIESKFRRDHIDEKAHETANGTYGIKHTLFASRIGAGRLALSVEAEAEALKAWKL